MPFSISLNQNQINFLNHAKKLNGLFKLIKKQSYTLNTLPWQYLPFLRSFGNQFNINVTQIDFFLSTWSKKLDLAEVKAMEKGNQDRVKKLKGTLLNDPEKLQIPYSDILSIYNSMDKTHYDSLYFRFYSSKINNIYSLGLNIGHYSDLSTDENELETYAKFLEITKIPNSADYTIPIYNSRQLDLKATPIFEYKNEKNGIYHTNIKLYLDFLKSMGFKDDSTIPIFIYPSFDERDNYKNTTLILSTDDKLKEKIKNNEDNLMSRMYYFDRGGNCCS